MALHSTETPILIQTPEGWLRSTSTLWISSYSTTLLPAVELNSHIHQPPAASTGNAAAWRSPYIVRARDRGAVCRRCVAVRTAQSRLRATEHMRHCVLSVKDSRCIRSALPSSCRGRWRRRSWRRGGGRGWVASCCCVKQRPDRQAVARSRKSGEVIEVLRR